MKGLCLNKLLNEIDTELVIDDVYCAAADMISKEIEKRLMLQYNFWGADIKGVSYGIKRQ